ncbi:MAG: M23 family metallopeptidase [Deltaproteobacteria bacterium]|nr:M23 family metallopeptidase [Deltaproteobacteria bacterium]
MNKRKKTKLYITIAICLFLLGFIFWLLSVIFEGEKPEILIEPMPEFLSGRQKFTLTLSDMKRGLKNFKILMNQEGREVIILEKDFPFTGLFNSEGIHKYDTEFSVDPAELNLAQGRVDLVVKAWDYSSRRGGDGNLSFLQHKMIVDTVPPSIRAISRQNYFNIGGTGLVVYRTSSDSIQSGIFVSDLFFPGFPYKESTREGIHACYFAVPFDIKKKPEIYLWAQDRAGNISKSIFSYNIRWKSFNTDRINITDRFLNRILPYFSFYSFGSEDSDIDKFLKINRDMRQENDRVFYELKDETSHDRLWEGPWLRLKNAANMAAFGDTRLYYYNNREIDRQIHLGVDLASLANSEVPAANNGRVIFANRNGIYGLTVVLDHGQGLASVYSHLSEMKVDKDQFVSKGDIIGLTGQTGLAGGDHLHFSVMASGKFVNPLEWWDSHWIQDNITRKLALVD